MLKSVEQLQENWRELNDRYFAGLLPSIAIVWSRRLTSSVGMFVSRGGPRPRLGTELPPTRSRREIRLSEPLMARLAEHTPYAEQELLNTLAHEMIHQWQFDVLKRRPNHGPDFLRKMTEMNRSGLVSITTYHSLQREVLALTRFAWRCTDCGRVYRRQRKSIEPRRHLCGVCRGNLQPLPDIRPESATAAPQPKQAPPPQSVTQLNFGWGPLPADALATP
ncbi:MAG: SprT-like domain-containing protein [Nitrospira sp.]